MKELYFFYRYQKRKSIRSLPLSYRFIVFVAIRLRQSKCIMKPTTNIVNKFKIKKLSWILSGKKIIALFNYHSDDGILNKYA